MLVVRDIFQLKFGKARDARQMLDRIMELNRRSGGGSFRCLTDFTGQAYRLILESEFESLADYEERLTSTMATEEWREAYQAFVPLVESSYREILRVVE